MVKTLVRVESCCPQLALSFWLYRSGWGSWEWGLVARKVSPDMASSGVGWGLPLVLWFPSGTVALFSLHTLVISSQFLFGEAGLCAFSFED